MRVIFCDNLIDRSVDPDFIQEHVAAINNGFDVSLISFEALEESNVAKSLAKVKAQNFPEPAIYRGWMMQPDKYELVYKALLEKNVVLVNTPEQYKTCHYLPLSYDFIKEWTPATKWLEVLGNVDFDAISALAESFKDEPIIVKDYVKSQKHKWAEACFIPNAADKNSVGKVVFRFLELQGAQLNVGLVFRKFVELEFLSNHSVSNMPLTKEFRLFFLNGEFLHVYNYWDEGNYGDTNPDLKKFIDIGKTIPSNFFSMDVAKVKNGDWIIMELGDGQVTGLPDNADKNEFYKSIKNLEQAIR